MSKTFVITSKVSVNGADFPDFRESITAGGGLSIDETIPAPSTDALVACVIDITQLKAVIMVSDVALEVNTNTLVGADVFALAAGVPFIWKLSSGLALPFTVDITALHLVLGGSTAARFQAEWIYDPIV